jgi:DedD protein
MSYLHDDIDDEMPTRSAYNSPAREVTLSTGTILGIFFALALLCAVFFGFGYNMGSKTRQAPVAAADSPAPATTDFSSFKPSPGTPASQPAHSTLKPADTPAPTTADVVPAPSTPVEHATPAIPAPAATKPHEPTESPVAASHVAPATEAGITFIVQVAAVSHQEDADLLIAALKRKGYAVNARSESQDKLIHIQVGPFAAKKDAEAMRQRLFGDGYNAIVK